MGNQIINKNQIIFSCRKFKPGNLYVSSIKNKVDDSICIYDRKKTQNVHIIPKEEKVLKSLNTIIGDLKELTIDQLVERLNCEKIDTEKKFNEKKQEKDNKCYIWGGNNGKISIPSECADTLKEYLKKS